MAHEEKDQQAAAERIKDEVQTLVSQGNGAGALSAAFANTGKIKDEAVKALRAEAAGIAFASVSDGDIAGIIDAFGPEEQDSAMKYVYKCMASGENCSSLLKWHAALHAKGGQGLIMRALVDRN